MFEPGSQVNGNQPTTATPLSAINFIGSLLAGALLATQVWAADLASAKNAGYVGERTDGYVDLVSSSAQGDVRALIEEINGKRRAEYSRISRRNKVSVPDVARLTAKKLIERASNGHYVQDAGGSWVRR